MRTALTVIPVLAAALFGCSPAKPSAGVAAKGNQAHSSVVAERPLTGGERALPMAVIYQTNGDYADCVPVTVSDGRLVSFPAPQDVAHAWPLRLSDGYLLDRRGINPDSRFTRYSYAEYGALASPPTPEALKSAIIPEGRVTEIRRLPFNLQQALADTARVNRLITDSLSSLEVVYPRMSVPAPVALPLTSKETRGDSGKD